MPPADNPRKTPLESNQRLTGIGLRSDTQAQASPGTGLTALCRALQNLCEQAGSSAEGRATIFAVCLTVVEKLSNGQPVKLRHAWANRLYQLADSLVAEGKA